MKILITMKSIASNTYGGVLSDDLNLVEKNCRKLLKKLKTSPLIISSAMRNATRTARNISEGFCKNDKFYVNSCFNTKGHHKNSFYCVDDKHRINNSRFNKAVRITFNELIKKENEVVFIITHGFTPVCLMHGIAKKFNYDWINILECKDRFPVGSVNTLNLETGVLSLKMGARKFFLTKYGY